MEKSFKRFQNIVKKELSINPSKFKPEAYFGRELGTNLLNIVELVVKILDQN